MHPAILIGGGVLAVLGLGAAASDFGDGVKKAGTGVLLAAGAWWLLSQSGGFRLSG